MSDTNYSGAKDDRVMLMGIVYVMLYRLAIIGSGMLSMYLGFRLFLSGLFPYAVEGSSFSAEILGHTFALQNAAPGLFFALFGMIIIVIMIVRSPPVVDITSGGQKNTDGSGEFQTQLHVEMAEADDELPFLD